MKTLILAIGPYQAIGLDTWHDHGAGSTYASARKAGCDVTFRDIRDLNNDGDIVNVIEPFDLIAFGLKSSYYPIAMRLIDIIKGMGKQVMIGGYHVTAAPSQLIENPDIDYIFHGESEITFPKFL